MEEFWIFASQKLPKTRNPSGTAHPAQPHGATVKSSFLVTLLVALTGCEGPEIRKTTTLQACVRPAGVTLTAFEADGALKWMPEMADEKVGIRFCDDTGTYRVIEVVGLQPGQSGNQQEGWAVDAHNQVFKKSDLDGMLATTPAPFPRLFKVTSQCIELPGATCAWVEPPNSAPGT